MGLYVSTYILTNKGARMYTQTNTTEKMINLMEKQNQLIQSTRVKAVQNAYNIKCLAVFGCGFIALFFAFMVATALTI